MAATFTITFSNLGELKAALSEIGFADTPALASQEIARTAVVGAAPAQVEASLGGMTAEEAAMPEASRPVRGANADKLLGEMLAKLAAATINNEADLLALASALAADQARLPKNKSEEWAAALATRKAGLVYPSAPTNTPASAAPAAAPAAAVALPPMAASAPAPAPVTSVPQVHPLDAGLSAAANALVAAGWPQETVLKLIKAATGADSIHVLPLDREGTLKRHRLQCVLDYCDPAKAGANVWKPEAISPMAQDQITAYIETNLPLAAVEKHLTAQGIAI